MRNLFKSLVVIYFVTDKDIKFIFAEEFYGQINNNNDNNFAYAEFVDYVQTATPPDMYKKLPVFDPADIKPLVPENSDLYFIVFKRFYKKEYKEEAEKGRLKVFSDNVKKVNALTDSVTSANFAINEFADLTLDEFHTYYTGFNASGINIDNVKVFDSSTNWAKPPSELDWSEKYDFVPRHQGKCKSSYIFSAIANIELQAFRLYGQTTYGSILEGYDCDVKGSCFRGGLPHLVMQAVQLVGGLTNDKTVGNPSEEYRIRNKGPCAFWKRYPVYFNVTEVLRFKVKKESDLVQAVFEYGPITTAIYVSEAVKNYRSGVLAGLECNKPFNHAVVIVGYGVSEQYIPYWILRNSWGTRWGEDGYFFVKRGIGDCGIGKYLVTVNVQEKQWYDGNMRDLLPVSPAMISAFKTGHRN